MNNRIRQLLQNRSTTSLVVLGISTTLIVSFLLITAGAYGLAWTETESFCISCHEMRDNVYVEFKDTVHDRNRTGVRAICSDCHVPRQPGPMIKRKIESTFELWGHFVTGVIDTRKKFLAHRRELAVRVWQRMKETDSLECRNCHKERKMDLDLQSEKARSRHEKGRKEGKTCIDCHYGIAHEEPEGPGPTELFGVKQPPAETKVDKTGGQTI